MSKSKACAEIVALQRRGQAAEAQALLDRLGATLLEAERAECFGNQAFLARRFQEAITYYERAIRIEPEHLIARYQYLVAVEAVKRKNYKEAFGRFVSAIEGEPDFVEPYVELGVMLLSVGDPKGAARCFEDALIREPEELGNYHNLVAAYKELAKSDKVSYEARLQDAVARYEEAKRRLQPIKPGFKHDVPRA